MDPRVHPKLYHEVVVTRENGYNPSSAKAFFKLRSEREKVESEMEGDGRASADDLALLAQGQRQRHQRYGSTTLRQRFLSRLRDRERGPSASH